MSKSEGGSRVTGGFGSTQGLVNTGSTAVASAPDARSAGRSVGLRARSAIRGSGLAQRIVAERMGLGESKLSKSLGGTRRFTADELLALATATGVTVRWLLSGDEDPGGVPAAGTAAPATPPPESLPATHQESDEHALSRRTIIERAWWLFAEKGYDGVRISDIAAAAGMSSPSVHYYFPSKRDIFNEALRYSVKLAFDRQSAQLPPDAGPVERLSTLVRLQLPSSRLLWAEWSIWLQTWSSVAVSGDRAEHAGSYGRWRDTVLGIIAAGRSSGDFVDTPPDEAADLLTALIDGLGIRVLTGLITADEMAEQMDNYIQRNLVRTAHP